MDTILDKLIVEWCDSLPDGTPDLNDPEKVQIFNTILSTYQLPLILESTKAAAEAETVLAICIELQSYNINKIFNDKKYADTIKIMSFKGNYITYLRSYYLNYLKSNGSIIEVYQKIIDSIKKLKLQSPVSIIGNLYYHTTDIWQQFGGEKKVKSKTDITVGNDSKRKDISIKSGDTKVRILDGGPAQTKAITYAALDQMQFSKKSKEHVIMLTEKLEKLMSKTKMNTIFKGKVLSRNELRNLSDSDKNKASKELKSIFDEFMRIRSQAEKYFKSLIDEISKDVKFKTKFIRESVTGEIMFDEESNSTGSAEYFLIFKDGLSDLKLIEITDSVIKKISGTFTTPQIGIKTAGNQLLGRSLLQVNVHDKIQEYIEDKIDILELCEEQLHEFILGVELNVLNESIFTDVIDNIIRKGKQVLDTILAFFIKIYNNLKESINKGIDSILESLGFEIFIDNNETELNITYNEL